MAKAQTDRQDDELLQDLGYRLRTNYASGYLTLLSIVLGVALATLSEQLFAQDGMLREEIAWRAAMTFVMICGTFYYYYFFVSFISVLPSFMQTIIPFALGSGLVGLAHMVAMKPDDDRFWIAAAGVFFISALAFANTMRLNNRKFYGEAVERRFRMESLKNIACFSLMTGLSYVLSRTRVAQLDRAEFLSNFAVLAICAGSTYIWFLRPTYRLINAAESRGETMPPAAPAHGDQRSP